VYLDRITLIGFIGSDAERKTANPTNIAIFSLATKTSWKNDAGSWESRTEWHRCVAFGKLADFAGTLSKGAHVAVEGELRSHEYQRELAVDTQKATLTRRVWEVRVDSVLNSIAPPSVKPLGRIKRRCPSKGISFSHSTRGLQPRGLMSIGQQHSLCCHFPGIPMMQSAQARRRNYGRFRRRLLFGRSAPTLLIFPMVTDLIALLFIHHVDQWLAGCEAFDVLAGDAYHPSVILIRTSGHVRCDDRVVELP
jgi:single-strand DNA-binding protein